MAQAWAADTAAGSGTGVAVGATSSTTGANQIAIGPNAKTDSTDSGNTGEAGIAIGNNARTETEVGLKGMAVVFMDPADYRSGNKNFGAGGIAIGENSVAFNGATVIGQHDYTGSLGDVAVSKDQYSNLQYGVGTTSVGYNSYTAGQYATSIGAYNVNSANYYPGGTNTVNGNSTVSTVFQGLGATIIGSFNSNESRSSQSAVSGMANSLIGIANRTQNSNGSLIFGAGNEITNSYASIYGLPSSAKDLANTSAKDLANTIRESVKNSDGGGATLAIGGANKADYTQRSQMIGVENSITGTAGNVSTNNMVNGYANKASNVNNVSVIGSENSITNTNTAVVVGDKRTLTGADNSVIIGSSSNGTATSVKNAVAIGAESNVTVEGGVALGANSIASTAAGIAGYDLSTGTASTDTSATWKATAAAVSVGNVANNNNVTRQITGVAAGAADTDAVNVAQLKKAAAAATTTVATTDSSNLTVAETPSGSHNYQVGLNKDLTGMQSAEFTNATGTEQTRISQAGIVITKKDSTTTKTNKIELNGTTGVSTFGTTDGQNVVITSNSEDTSIAVGNKVTDIADATAGVTITDAGDIIASGEDADTGVKILGSTGEITASGTITADGDYPVVLNGSDGTLTTGNTVVRTTGLWVTDGQATPALTTAVTNDGIVITKTVDNVTTTNSLTSSGLVATSGAFSGNVTVGTGTTQITLEASTGTVKAPLATIGGITIGTDGKISNLTSGLVANDNTEAVTGDAVYDAIAAAKWSAVVYASGVSATGTTVNVPTNSRLGFAAGKNMSVSVNEGVITYATSATPTFDSVTVGTADGDQTTISGGAVSANTVTTGNTSMSTTGVTVTDATNASVKTTVSSTGVKAADGTNTTTISSTGVVIGDGSNTNKLTTEGLTATTGSFSGNVTVGVNDDGSAKITLNATDGSVTATSATIGGISIGTDGKISNLTSGTIEANNKEAVTGGAVYSYVSGSYVSKADAGWNIKVGNAEADKIGTDATVSFNAGSTNVSLSYNADTNAVTVDTAKDVTFDTVTANTSIQVGTGENATKITGNSVSAQTLKAGNSTVTTDGLSVKTADGTKTSTVTTNGLSVTDGTNTASYQANGVTVGKDGANALTTDGLTASAAKIKGDVSVGDQITMAADTGTITATNAKFGNLTFNTTGVEIAGGPSLTSNGIDAANLTIRNVKNGELSATSTEAVNGSQLYATNQAVEANTNSITALRGDTTRLKNRINRVGAQSAALAALQPLPFAEGQNVSVSIGAGAYRGAAAGALGIYYRPTENMMLSLGGSVTAGDVMGNVGFSYRFGTSGLTTEKPQTMAAKISSLSKENADLTAQLTAARTRLESQETRLLKLEALVEKLSAGK